MILNIKGKSARTVRYSVLIIFILALSATSLASDYLIQDSNGNPLFAVNDTGETQVYEELDLNGNRVNSVGALDLGWENLTDYPGGCETNEAVRVIGDTLDCAPLNPGGTVETGGGAEGQVAFFRDTENITGTDNLYWNNSQIELGIGTNTPSAMLDVNGDTQLNGDLDLETYSITGIGDLEGSEIVDSDNIKDESVSSTDIGSGEVTSQEINTGISGTGLSGGEGSALSVNTDTGLTTGNGDVEIDNSVVPRKGIDESISASRWTFQNNVRIQGNLDVWGNIQNTDVENLNINGSLYPPSGYSDTFDVGSTDRRWATGYFQDLELGSGAVQNDELNYESITVNANTGLSGGGTPSLGEEVDLSHADTSTITDTSNSQGTVIQDLQFDEYGHVDGVTGTNLDDRYYTETESDDNFVEESGDTMSDNLDISTSGQEALTIGNSNHAEHYIRFRDDSQFGATLGYNPGGGNNGAVRLQSGDGKNMEFAVNSGTFGEGQTALTIDEQANLQVSNSIENFFDSNCQNDEVVASVNSDGTYNCQSITGAADDTYVNEGGDTMTDALNMSGNNIENVGTINASIIEDNGENIIDLFVDEGGDSMSGPLNMGDNDINNVNTFDFNSIGNIQTDGTNAVNIDGDQNVEIPNGGLNVGGYGFGITGYTGGGGGATIDVGLGNDIKLKTRGNRVIYGSASGSAQGTTIYTGASSGGGSSDGQVALYDQYNDQDLLVAQVGGNVTIPNGNLNLGGTQNNQIINVQDPDNAQDVATKNYVDDEITASNPSVETFDSADGNVNVDPLQTLQVDEGAGFRLTDQGNGVARLSMGSHWKTLYIDGSEALVPDGQESLNFATSSDISITSDSTSSPKTLSIDVDESQLAGTHLSGSSNSISVDDDFLENDGDTMGGDLDMNYNRIDNVGELNVSSSNSRIAEFSDTGIEFDQPLSLDSSGPLSVSNGVDLTGTSSNTIDSYSTMYLETSSGSPSDIVLDPSGDVGVDANMSVTGDLDLQGGALEGVGSSNIDVGDGSGDIDMNGNQIYNAGTSQFTGVGITDTLNNAQNEVSGYSMYVQDDVTVGGDVVGTGADVAEMVETQEDKEYESGTVVTISGEEEVKASESARDTAVAGVVSTDPGVRLAKETDGIPLALSGRVPVKATVENGDIEPGDLLTSSDRKGYAMKCKDSLDCHGAIIGKAMGDLNKTGKVEMLVTLG